MVSKSSKGNLLSPENKFTTMLNDQTVELSFVRNRLETLQANVLRGAQNHMSSMVDEVMQELRQHQVQITEFRNFATPPLLHHHHHSHNINTGSDRIRTIDHPDTTNNNINDKELKNSLNDLPSSNDENAKKSPAAKHHILPDKIFVTRESLLTALLEVDHMKTIYNIFNIIFLAFLLNNVSYEYFVNGRINFGQDTFKKGFARIHQILGILFCQHIFVFSIYYALKGWSRVRTKLAKYQTLRLLWSVSCLSVYIVMQLVFAFVPTKICLHLNLTFVTASVLLLETVRLLMKMHSFVRTVTPRVLAGKLKAEEATPNEVNFPEFNKYLYFLFAPTLLYRDAYPRTAAIRWKFAFARLLEVVAVAFLYGYIYERHIKYNFENFGKEEISAAAITVKLFSMLMPSIIIFLITFYMILHSYLNFTSELLRFGDRMFYRDWWTASNYATYYRNWNVVVHDWLFEYLYKDFYNHIFKGSKVLSSIMVFFISALFHEYILGYGLQLFFPVMFVLFAIIGVALIFLTRRTPKNFGNIFLWFSLIYGNGIMISLYSMEYFARINCSKELNEWRDYLIPRVWSCYFKSYTVLN